MNDLSNVHIVDSQAVSFVPFSLLFRHEFGVKLLAINLLAFNGKISLGINRISQLRKLYNVKKVIVLSAEECIKRELLLIKVRNTEQQHADIVEATNIFRTKIIDFTDEAISIEATGDSQKIDAFIEYMKKFDIIEMCRTGLVALDRGGANIWSEHED